MPKKLVGIAARWKMACLLTLVLVSAGCAVKWTPLYDDTLDKSITTFQENTEAYLTKLESLPAPPCTYEQNLSFYQQASVQLSVMQTRATASQHNTFLLEQISALSKVVDNLKTLQQQAGNTCLNSTVIESQRSGFDRVFEAMLAYELALKANVPPAPSK